MSDETDAGITLRYQFARPVEISDFSGSLSAVGDFYRLQRARRDDIEKDVRLFIKEIRQGSIEVELIEMAKGAALALPAVIAATKTAAEAVSRLADIIGWFKGEKPPPTDITKKEIEAARTFVNPIAENGSSAVAVFIKDSPNAQIFIGTPDANMVQNGATKALENMRAPTQVVHREVPLVWSQTDRHGPTGRQTRHRAIIEAVAEHPVPVYFPEGEREALQRAMIDEVQYPYRATFIVDVESIVVQSAVKGVRVLRLHDVLEG